MMARHRAASQDPRPAPALLLSALLVCCLAAGTSGQAFSYGQATWYDSITNGACGYGGSLPPNSFVGAWPFIETGFDGSGYWQPSLSSACGVCFEVSCVPGQFVESADGSIFLDRRDVCADPSRGIIIQIVDECRCSLPRFPGQAAGNYQWCCNTPTPCLGVNRHIDLSQQAFAALARDFNLGIMPIKWRQVPCTNVGATVTVPVTTPPTGGGSASDPTTPIPPGYTGHDMAQTTNEQIGLWKQCGGAGGVCQMFGGSAACTDSAWPGYACHSGATCARQSNWFWQCVPGSSSSSAGGSTSSSSGGTTSSSSSGGSSSGGGSTTLALYDQCGGAGGDCSRFTCADSVFPSTACPSGAICARQSSWYWQCVPGGAASSSSGGAASSSSSSGGSTSSGGGSTSSGGGSTAGTTLALYGQCGGAGGDCSRFTCADSVFPGTACPSGATCARQSSWYWQCVP